MDLWMLIVILAVIVAIAVAFVVRRRHRQAGHLIAARGADQVRRGGPA